MDRPINPPRPSLWIISPTCDVCFLIATPLLIFPLLLLLAQYSLTAEQIALYVFAFASLGHHLPGLMRAYGDRELFMRFRWRFLIAPPLILAASWTSFIWLGLNGLALILLFWATWHILMQTYGFLRIYDSKRGRVSRWDVRWDFWTCIAVFTAGVVFSDARVFGIADLLAHTGLPIISAEWLAATRWIVGIGTGVLLTAYVARSLYTWQHAPAINAVKLLLLGSTTFLYWMTGQLSMDILLGVAMFEIFHAVQYYAIVWFYNRRRAERVGGDFGPLSSMFRGNWWGLPVYLIAIFLFGALGFWGRSGNAESVAVVTALFSASAMLHFYYDGFIWRVRERKTREDLNLSVENSTGPLQQTSWRHGLGWMALTFLLISLMALEYRNKPTPEEEQRQLAQLSALTPNLPEVQIRVSQASLLRGEPQTAYDLVTKAVRLRPRSYQAHLVLGNAAAKIDDWKTAERSYAIATDLQPDSAEAHYGLGLAQFQLGKYEAAQQSLESCLRIEPNHAQAHFQIGNVFYRNEQPQLAITSYRRCTELDPDFADAFSNLAETLLETGSLQEAEAAYLTSLKLKPNQYEAHFQLGNVFYFTKRLDSAINSYRRCIELQPEFVEAYNNLGSALMEVDDLAESETIYRKAISLQPDNAAAHYNLGLVLYFQGNIAEARTSIIRADQLGQHPSRELADALQLH